jgi:hypothetical protein
MKIKVGEKTILQMQTIFEQPIDIPNKPQIEKKNSNLRNEQKPLSFIS